MTVLGWLLRFFPMAVDAIAFVTYRLIAVAVLVLAAFFTKKLFEAKVSIGIEISTNHEWV